MLLLLIAYYYWVLLHVHLPSKSNVLYIISSLRLFFVNDFEMKCVGELVISSNYVNVWATSSATNQIWYVVKFSQSAGYGYILVLLVVSLAEAFLYFAKLWFLFHLLDKIERTSRILHSIAFFSM